MGVIAYDVVMRSRVVRLVERRERQKQEASSKRDDGADRCTKIDLSILSITIYVRCRHELRVIIGVTQAFLWSQLTCDVAMSITLSVIAENVFQHFQ